MEINVSEMNAVEELVLSAKPFITDEADTDAVTEKGDADFVTKVDLKVQSYIKSALLRDFPAIQFMGEEGERENIDFRKPVWILDPIDGTTNLIHRYNMSAVSLALVENGRAVFGLIYNPFHNELFKAAKGSGAFLNGKRINVSKTAELRDSLVSIGTMPYVKTDADEKFELFKRIFLNSVDIRRGGSAALDLAYVACGRTDAFFESGLKPWDYAAGCIILEEAGGKVTDYDGNPVRFDENSSIIAGNKAVYGQLLPLIRGD